MSCRHNSHSRINSPWMLVSFFFFQAEDGIRDIGVTGVQTCALPISVISAMADRHKKEITEMLERARQAPSLLESLEILFTAHCCEDAPQVVSAFVVDLYAEASRNPHVADLVRDVLTTAMDDETELIVRAPEAQYGRQGFSPADLQELTYAEA